MVEGMIERMEDEVAEGMKEAVLEDSVKDSSGLTTSGGVGHWDHRNPAPSPTTLDGYDLIAPNDEAISDCSSL
ncbi:hypothetical protein LTR09_012357 [Extremus antarcticus]|uniref:Uncharacterized protein n=1 Tax=Extremus antarcticus TaxID=702011 RepID=A0AAJ0DA74_9PEZI|nr:hypothetical protein LTR09_012357 [Extremus antarcticus]